MRYTLGETAYLVGKFNTGSTVTMNIVDLSTDTSLALDSNSCSELVAAPGYYVFDLSNITTPLSGYTNCLCVMSDGSNEFLNKIVVSGYPDTLLTGVSALPANIWGYSTRTLTEDVGIDETVFHSYLTSYTGKNDWKADVTGIPAAVWAYSTRALTEDISMNEVQFHSHLNTYANKDAWRADVSAIPESVWTYGTRTLTAGAALTEDEHDAIMSINYQCKAIFVNSEVETNGDGTALYPFDNMNDAKDLAEEMGICQINVVGEVTLHHSLKNLTIVGVGVPVINTNGQDLKNTHFEKCELRGTYTDQIVAQECVLANGFTLNGFFDKCMVVGTHGLNANAYAVLIDCFSQSDDAVFDMDAGNQNTLNIRNYSGAINVINMDNVHDLLHIDIAQGSITFYPSCVAGVAHLHGCGELVDNSNGASIYSDGLQQNLTAKTTWEYPIRTLTDSTGADVDFSTVLDFIEGSWKIIGNQMIYYKRDNTELMRFDLLDSAGQPVSRGAMQRVRVIP